MSSRNVDAISPAAFDGPVKISPILPSSSCGVSYFVLLLFLSWISIDSTLYFVSSLFGFQRFRGCVAGFVVDHGDLLNFSSVGNVLSKLSSVMCYR